MTVIGIIAAAAVKIGVRIAVHAAAVTHVMPMAVAVTTVGGTPAAAAMSGKKTSAVIWTTKSRTAPAAVPAGRVTAAAGLGNR